MTTHLDTIVRVSLVLGLALPSMALFRRRSASVRRLVLSAAFASALVAPFVPAWRSSGPAYHALVGRLVAEPGASGVAIHAGAPPIVARSVDWLFVVWAMGAAIVAIRFLAGHLAALRIARRARPAVGWNVRESVEVDAPAVIGVFSPVIVVPTTSSSWSDERRRAVLLHERAHVESGDLAVQWLVSIVCSLHWFNPLAWLIAGT